MLMPNKLSTLSVILIALLAVAGCAKLCTLGYEGRDCNTLSKGRFIGVWTATVPPATVAYNDTISDTTGISSVVISRSFAAYSFKHQINASVSNSIITVNLQQPDSDGRTVQGNGTLNTSGNTINWSYTVTNALDSATLYTEVWSK